jgi:hypothetical protein
VAEGANTGRRVAGVALVLGFVVALVLATQREAAVECDVCVAYGGREACRTGSGADRDTALRGAVNTACAALASGCRAGRAALPPDTRQRGTP